MKRNNQFRERTIPYPDMPKYNRDMGFVQIHELITNAIPTDRGVSANVLLKMTGLPYTIIKMHSKLKGQRNLEVTTVRNIIRYRRKR